MPRRLPPLAYLLGLAGLIPFVGCGVLAVSKGPWQSIGMAALIAYGAVSLSFLGGVHWGFALTPANPEPNPPVQRARLALGVVPSLIGWAAVLLGQAVRPELGVAVLIAGLLATVAVEVRWSRRQLMPGGYMALRWALSVVVLITLVTVLGLRLIGATIVF